MKRSTKFAFAAVATLGLGAVAVPVIAQQTHLQHGGMMGGGMEMMGGHSNMMGRAMGMMMGGAGSYAMATFDTDSDGTLSPEEMTAGIQAELTTYDTDANGTLSLEEFAVMHAAHTRPMTVRAFQMHDADGDAQVTDAEMAAMAAMMQNRMSKRQGDMPGAGRGMMGNN
jgi:Ca2+-binding EF-hand superfamily protein